MKVYVQKDGIFICGKIKEVRLLLQKYSRRYRTVKKMIGGLLN